MQQKQYPEVPDDFGHWLAGFIDGEGCFTITRSGATGWSMRFSIKLRDDDRAVLDEIQRTTGMGKVYAVRIGKGHTPGAKPQATWIVGTKADLLRLVRLLDRCPLRGKKMLDYMLWREAVLYRKDGRRRPKAARNWGPIPRLYEQLREVKAYAPHD